MTKYKSNNHNRSNNSKSYNSNSNKSHFNFEHIAIKGNIGSDIFLKTKARERIEFCVAINKFNKSNNSKVAKWFSVIAFDEAVILEVKNNPNYKKGANVEISGEVFAEIYQGKPVLKIIARQIALNITNN